MVVPKIFVLGAEVSEAILAAKSKYFKKDRALLPAMDKNQFCIEMIQAADSACRPYLVALHGRSVSGNISLGTGSLLRHGQRLFILTCRHVAQEFFAISTEEAMVIRPAPLGTIDRTDLRLVHEDEDDDIALIEVIKSNGIPQLDRVLSLNDLAFIDNFRDMPADGRSFVLTGFPSDAIVIDHVRRRTNLIPVSYLTYHVNDPVMPAHCLYLDYHAGEDQLLLSPERGTHRLDPLLKPFGYSGTAVRMIPKLNQDPNIWHFGMSKIVAIQQSTNQRNWVQCSSLRQVQRWLNAAS